MKKTIILALALALVGGAAYANFCARDVVPSASLLVPYIVVDTDATGNPNPNGYTTLTVVTNVSSAKQLIHVTVYNAVSRGVVDFDEVLSGYDVWSINWRDLLTGSFQNFDTGPGFWTGTIGTVGDPFGPTTNVLPGTFVGLDDPQDTDYSPPASTGCGFPWGDLSAYAGIIKSGLTSPLKAYTTHDTDCLLATTIDRITPTVWLTTLTASPVFFYATIDVVTACNGLFPDRDALYWNNAYNTLNNVLTGYDFYLNFTSNYSESTPAVHLEASTIWTGVGFYDKQRAAALATDLTDDREPLANAFGFNYFNAAGITTEVAVWKSHEEIDDPAAGLIAACRPYIYYAFDENENSKGRTVTTCPSGLCFGNPEPNVFPFETQKVPVTATNFTGLMPANGWMMLIFDPAIPYSDAIAGRNIQAYAFAKYNYGAYSTSVEASILANVYCFGTQQALPFLNAYNGTGRWYAGPATP